MLVTLFKVPSFDSVDDFLQKVATVRGKLKKGGVVDVEAAARIVLHDWNQGMYQSFMVYVPWEYTNKTKREQEKQIVTYKDSKW